MNLICDLVIGRSSGMLLGRTSWNLRYVDMAVSIICKCSGTSRVIISTALEGVERGILVSMLAAIRFTLLSWLEVVIVCAFCVHKSAPYDSIGRTMPVKAQCNNLGLGAQFSCMILFRLIMACLAFLIFKSMW